MADVAQILMCRPDYYGIYYEINPWMSIKGSHTFPNSPTPNNQNLRSINFFQK